MNDLQLSLTRLIGKKELTFGCRIKYDTDEYIFLSYTDRKLDTFRLQNSDLGIEEISEEFGYEIIGHPATLTDLHRWMNKNNIGEDYFEQDCDFIRYNGIEFQYISSKDLLDQDEETLKQIISIINQ